jgi:hypothetical protein
MRQGASCINSQRSLISQGRGVVLPLVRPLARIFPGLHPVLVAPAVFSPVVGTAGAVAGVFLAKSLVDDSTHRELEFLNFAHVALG